MVTCQQYSEDALHRYVKIRMPKVEAEALERHLVVCESCRGQLAAICEAEAATPWLGDGLLPISRGPSSQLGEEETMQGPGRAATDLANGEGIAVDEVIEQSAARGLPNRIGSYTVIRLVATGGMGTILEAYDSVACRRVALKLIRGSTQRRLSVQRMMAEAHALARLSHPGIVGVYGVEMDRGQPALVLEFVDGLSLDQWQSKRMVEARLAAELVRKLSLAVAHAHGRGVIHRDLKPANVMLQGDPPFCSLAEHQEWEPKVTDFGISRMVDRISTTQAGELMGTPAYMAPEQTTGTTTDFGPAVDVYGLGAILYELLTGRPPFMSGDPVMMLEVVRNVEPVAPKVLRPDLPVDLNVICLKCLEKTPQRRFKTADELAEELSAFLQHRPIKTRPLSSVERTFRWARRNAKLATALAVIAALFICSTFGALAVAFYFRQTEWYFRQLEGEQRTLAERNQALAEEKDLASRQSQRLLANAYTAEGIQAAADGREREAVLWFAHAALVTERLLPERSQVANLTIGQQAPTAEKADKGPVHANGQTPRQTHQEGSQEDWEQLQQHVNRVRIASQRIAHPIAILPTSNHVERLSIHPSGLYLLMQSPPDQNDTLFYLESQQTVWFPDLGTPESLAWTSNGLRVAAGVAGKVCLYTFPEFSKTAEITCEFLWPTGMEANTGELGPSVGGEPSVAAVEKHDESTVAQAGLELPRVCCLSFDRTGRYLAIAGERVVRVWDCENQTFTSPPYVHAELIEGLLFSPDSRLLVTQTKTSKFFVFAFTLAAERPIWGGEHLINPAWPRNPPCFTFDGRRLVTLPNVGSIDIWNVDKGELEQSIDSPVGFSYCLDVASTRPEILVGGNQGLITYDLQTGTTSATLTDVVTFTAAYGPRDEYVVSGRISGKTQMWSLAEQRELAMPAVHAMTCRRIAFSPDGQLLVTAGEDQQIRVWKLPQPEADRFSVRINELGSHLGAFSPDSRLIAITAESEHVLIYDISLGREIARISQLDSQLFIRVIFLPDGERLATFTASQQEGWRLELWKWRSGERLSKTPLPSWPQLSAQHGLIANQPGTRLIVICKNGTVLVFDTTVPEGRLLREWTGPPTQWFQLSSDGLWLAGATSSEGIIWNIETGQLRPIGKHAGDIRFSRFSPDGRWLATASEDATVKLWDVVSGEQIGKPWVHPAPVHFVEFSPDGRLLLTVCQDLSARVWEVAEQRMAAAPITAPEDLEVCFRAAGRQLLVADYEGRLEAWNWRHRQRLMPSDQIFRNHAFFWNGKRKMVLSPDQRFVALGDSQELHVIPLDALDGTALPPAEELVRGAEVLSHLRLQDGSTANLTSEEWYQRWKQVIARSKNPRQAFSFGGE